MKTIQTNNAPKAVGPYSQAIETEQFIFCSGQVGIDPETGSLVDGIENQMKQVMSNISNVLSAAGTDLDHVVKTTIFLADMGDYKMVNEIYGSYFPEHKPARSTVQIAALPLGALVEIEMIAAK
ncbi:RidA family protein [Candidatus Roizmanbacteria bacterium]|nr:MAG: RidA family protein [Candidatus Roizmanbacteria bacterium]